MSAAPDASLSIERWTKRSRCPVCDGSQDDASGKGVRCSGYRSSDGEYLYCSREEHSGGLPIYGNTDCYLHRAAGSCKCGTTHCDAPPLMEKATRPRSTRNVKPKAKAKTPKTYPTLDAVVAVVERSTGGTVEDRYNYQDEKRATVLVVFRVRLSDNEEGKPQKTFRQATPEGGRWKLSTTDARRVPFRLPELLAAIEAGDPIHVVEGEKDVLAIEAAGGVATCNVGGAGKPKALAACVPYFKGADLVLIVADQDADGKGQQHAEAWADAFDGIAARIKLARPVEGKDAHDALAAGHRLSEAFELIERAAGGGPNLVSLADIPPEAVEWLWRGYIPAGKLTDVVGDGDLGKSLVMLDIVARVTTGRPMPGDPLEETREPRNVVLMVAEDDLADTVVPRLTAAGADLSRVHVLEGPREGSDGGIVFPDHIDAVEDSISRTNAALLVIDPVMGFLGDVKTGVDSEVRTKLMGPLKRIASKYGCGVLSLRHTNKSEGASASMRGGGSVAFRNATRAGLAFGPDHNDGSGTRRFMAPSKNNLGQRRDALAYHIESTYGRVEPEGVEGTPIVVWEGVAEGVTAADVLGPPPKAPGPREGTKTADCVAAIRARLGGNVEVASKVMEAELSAAGFSAKVIANAKSYAGVRAVRASEGAYGTGRWGWTLD